MARTVVAIYDDFQTANNALRDLVDSGFPRDNISIVANDSKGEYGTTTRAEGDAVADETGAGAGVGAGIGAAIGGIGGLLVGLGALVIPGIGPVIAAGPLAVALSTLTGAGVGAVAGGVTGGLLGALIGLGIPEEEAEYYVEGVRRGGILVTVQADESNTDHVMNILNRYNPIDINERAAQWREQGWTGFDPNAPATTRTTDMDRDVTDSDFDRSRNRDFERNEGTMSSRDMDTARDRGMHEDRELDREYDPVEGSMPVTGEPRSAETRDQDFVGFNEYNEQTVRRGTSGMNDYDSDFDVESPIYRNHYNTYLADTGYPYEHYIPAYRYGYGMASDARYQNRTWDQVETDVRHDWEREHPGTWERFKMAIRHAWEDITGQDRDRRY